MRLGIFGGTFDPVHYGHLLLAECCREQCRLDAVRFLPAGVPPHKPDARVTPAAARIEMLELALAPEPAFSVCRREADRGGLSYTVDTLAHYQREQPDAELFFLLGADMLNDLPDWREPAQICQLATIVVVRRSGTRAIDFNCLTRVISPQMIDRIRSHQVEMPEIGISGTEIRRRAAAGLSIRYRTPRAVEEYIRTHGLYMPG
jgi:nicotinate-nucleotide adenylyltransferase